MKKISVILFIIIIPPVIVHASDFLVELTSEKYHEKMIPGNGNLKISHTWQVRTKFGNKVLVLLGLDYNFRKWLRQDSKKNKLWAVKIPDEADAKFKYNISVYIDINQLQPVIDKEFRCFECRGGPPPVKPVSSTSIPKKTP